MAINVYYFLITNKVTTQFFKFPKPVAMIMGLQDKRVQLRFLGLILPD